MENYRLEENNGVTLVILPGLEQRSGIRHAFTTRTSGLNLSYKTGDDPERVLENRRRVGKTIGFLPERWAGLDQVHGRQVFRVDAPGDPLGEADGMVTRTAGILLTVSTADCVPVLLAGPDGTVGAVHAGWRGTLARAAQAGVEAMKREFGTEPADLFAGIGPCIGRCCYSVGDEVAEAFSKEFSGAEAFMEQGKDGRIQLDLAEANTIQLREAGLKPENIFSAGLCTACRTDLFFSHRKEGKQAGRMMGMIGINK